GFLKLPVSKLCLKLRVHRLQIDVRKRLRVDRTEGIPFSPCVVSGSCAFEMSFYDHFHLMIDTGFVEGMLEIFSKSMVQLHLFVDRSFDPGAVNNLEDIGVRSRDETGPWICTDQSRFYAFF